MTKEIEENLVYIKQLQGITDTMEQRFTTNVIEEFVRAGAYLRDYKRFKEMAEKDALEFRNVFTLHRSRGPHPQIDIDAEIEILKKKFNELNYGYDKREITQLYIKEKKDFPKDKLKRIPQVRKIYCPRWLSKTVAEYNIDAINPAWELYEWKTNLDFLPFCGFAYLPNFHIMSIGGLNNKIPGKHTFSSRWVKIKIENYNYEKLDNLITYDCEDLRPMKVKRGLMGTVFMNGHVYVAGGVTQKMGDQKSAVINKCERYNLETDTWDVIAPMNKKRKNTSLWSFGNKHIYAFGGCQQEYSLVEVIERYIPYSEFDPEATRKYQNQNK